MKPKLFLDMDDTIVDFITLFDKEKTEDNPYPHNRDGFFLELEPYDGMLEAVEALRERYDIWFVTKPSIWNPRCYSDKARWIEKYFGQDALDHLILCTHKDMIKGGAYDVLLDDYDGDGQRDFDGTWLQYDNELMPWGEYKHWMI